MERREFIKNCALICGTGFAASALLSCKGIHYANATTENNKVRVSKSEFNDEKSQRAFVVVRNEQLQFPICVYYTAGKYTALYMQCTHQGCELQPNKISLVCPCHGSEFSNEGKVQSAPADTDLRQFKVITDNENIYIEI
jgi:cytochrome b6-f complex iron-sulfur subunit